MDDSQWELRQTHPEKLGGRGKNTLIMSNKLRFFRQRASKKPPKRAVLYVVLKTRQSVSKCLVCGKYNTRVQRHSTKTENTKPLRGAGRLGQIFRTSILSILFSDCLYSLYYIQKIIIMNIEIAVLVIISAYAKNIPTSRWQVLAIKYSNNAVSACWVDAGYCCLNATSSYCFYRFYFDGSHVANLMIVTKGRFFR